MGLASLVGKTRKVKFVLNNNDVIVFDASIKESHGRESPATELPVENGQTISDNIIIKPFKLTLEGIITDTPIGTTRSLLTEVATTLTSALLPPVGLLATSAVSSLFSALAQSSSPSVAAYGQLLQLQAGINGNGPQPFDVITTLYRYKSMWIQSISAPREASTGNALLFTVNLTELILVTPQSVNVSILANAALSAALADEGEKSASDNPAARGYRDEKSFEKSIGGISK